MHNSNTAVSRDLWWREVTFVTGFVSQNLTSDIAGPISNAKRYGVNEMSVSYCINSC
jgi:hypothetical protein